jgi:hypothetical protein
MACVPPLAVLSNGDDYYILLRPMTDDTVVIHSLYMIYAPS